MKLNLVDDIDDCVNPGDAYILGGTDKKTGQPITQLAICCPGCGKTSGSAGSHVYNRVTQSYKPSIRHNKSNGGCGWHGWLTNGIFTKVK